MSAVQNPANTTTVSVRLEDELHRRLKAKLAAEGSTFQGKIHSLLLEYLDGPAEDREQIARQVAIAREGMRKYAGAMRELAR